MSPNVRLSVFVLPALLATAGTIAVLACSSTTETPGGGADASTSVDTGTPSDQDGSSASDSGDAGTVVTDHQGSIFAVSESVTSPSAAANYRAGAFFAIGAKSSDDVVSTATFGTCTAQTLKPGQGSDGTDVSAGKLTISGGSKTIEITPKADNTYAPSTSNSQTLWTGGEQLTAKLEGAAGGLPAFQASLTAPSRLKITAPLLAADAGKDSILDVTRSAGLSLAWTGSTTGTLVAYFSSTTGVEAHTLLCRFSPAAGSAQVPKEALATLTTGEGFFDIYVEEKSTPTVKDWDVSFNVSTNTNSGSGANMTGTARIK